MTPHGLGLLILRLGLASVFLWFGFSQIFDGIAWVSWVPEWAVTFFRLPPAMIVLGNGLFEVAFGTLLAMGLVTRVAAGFLALHMALIVFHVGLTPIGVRDFGLMLATASLIFLSNKRLP